MTVERALLGNEYLTGRVDYSLTIGESISSRDQLRPQRGLSKTTSVSLVQIVGSLIIGEYSSLTE